MTQITIQPVTTKWQQRSFLEFPWKHYRDDPNWIPPLRRNQRELLGYAPHPFHDYAEMQTFLAQKDGHILGRIAAVVNNEHNRRYDEKRGFFGFFESIDDPDVATGLIEAAAGWLVQRGMTDLRGPCNPSLNYECGLLIDGFHGTVEDRTRAR